MKTLIKLILFIAIIAVVGYFCWQKGWLNQFLGTGNELKIDQTASVVEEVKKISEFTSVKFYEELVIDEKKASKWVDNKAGNLLSKLTGKDKKEISNDELVIIAKGTVRAGFDLSAITDSSFSIYGDTIRMVLPQAKILDVIINPSDFEIYEEDGEWTHEEVVALESKATKQLEQDALEYGILEKATSTGKQKLTSLFKSFGYNVVEF